MKIEEYLTKIGLADLAEKAKDIELNSIVDNAFEMNKAEFTLDEIQKLYEFKVPPLSPDGSCSVDGEPENFSLYDALEIDKRESEKHTETIRLWRLNEIVKKAQDLIGADWFGIYRKIPKKGENYSILLKEAYDGAISRPEFPLTKEFASHSNNSTVGMTGKAVIVKSVSDYEGPYYECDGRVESEFCCPILSPQGDVLGIIDAESFEKNFFTNEKLIQIAKICMDLG